MLNSQSSEYQSGLGFVQSLQWNSRMKHWNDPNCTDKCFDNDAILLWGNVSLTSMYHATIISDLSHLIFLNISILIIVLMVQETYDEYCHHITDSLWRAFVFRYTSWRTLLLLKLNHVTLQQYKIKIFKIQFTRCSPMKLSASNITH